MAHENTWSSLEDGQPTGANLLGQVDDFVRQTRQMVRERIALEHDFNFLINDQQGYHRQGSARVWVSDTQPTSPIPDPTSTETVGSETIGRCWFKPSTGEYFVYDKTSASWIPVNLTTLQMAALLHAMTAKTSLADNDEFALADSAAAYGPKKTLWSTVKSVIKTALSIGGSNALSQDNIGDGSSYKRISAAKADKINAGTYSEDDLADGTSYKRVQAAKATTINGTTDANITNLVNLGLAETADASKNITHNTSGTAKRIISGNGNTEGASQFVTVVKLIPTVSQGTELTIPFVSQTSLHRTTIAKVMGHTACYNHYVPLGFTINFSVSHLNSLSNLTSWGGGGNYASITTSGMNVIITFTGGYNYGTGDKGLFLTIEYMTSNVSYSIDSANIVLN